MPFGVNLRGVSSPLSDPWNYLLVLAPSAAIAAIVISTHPPLDWGDVPTWIAASAAVVALLAAFRAGRAAIEAGKTAREVLEIERNREDRAERYERERNEAAERGEQADWVAAWHELSPDRRTGHVRVLNGSRLPVWGIRVAFLDAHGQSRGEPASASVIPPGRERMFGWPIELREASGLRDGSSPRAVLQAVEDFAVTIQFRDAAGRLWRRSALGRLELLARPITGTLDVNLASALEANLHLGYAPPDGQ